MAILLTAGLGKTSQRITRFCQESSITFLLASRRGQSGAPAGMPAVTLDWTDPSTFENPFQYEFSNGQTIQAVYLVAAGTADPAPNMNAFVDLARLKYGVQRFVLVGGSTTEPGERHVGKVWSHLLETGVEYSILRPTWFMENFSEEAHQKTIKAEDKIYTACGDAKIPFISATDIAHVAFHALTDSKAHNCDYRVLGSELLTYDEVAAKLTKHLGHLIKHVKLSDEERKQRFVDFGLPEHYADRLVQIEIGTRNGAEDRMNNAVEQVTGKKPISFDQFAEENKSAWQ